MLTNRQSVKDIQKDAVSLETETASFCLLCIHPIFHLSPDDIEVHWSKI